MFDTKSNATTMNIEIAHFNANEIYKIFIHTHRYLTKKNDIKTKKT